MSKTLKKIPEKTVQTSSGLPIDLVYGPERLSGFDTPSQLGQPGEFPFTRWIQPTMYRGRLWTMRQYAGMGDAEESNRRSKFLLANGTKGLRGAVDLPTHVGDDSDHT